MTYNVVYINRPWISSFSFEQAPYSEAKLEQVHKLSRNFTASLDLGCPHVRHVKRTESVRADYKAWVADWKVVYREVSKMIRLLKTFRKTVKFPALSPEQNRMLTLANPGLNSTPAQHLNGLAHRQLERLQETAQVLLNARYNAKLAAGMARLRDRAAAAAAPEVAQAA